MKTKIAWMTGSLVLLFSWAAAQEEASLERAQQILTAVKLELRKVQVDGYTKAQPGICSARASKVFEEASLGENKVGRASHKLRNPKNEPKPWMIAILEEFKNSRVNQPAKPRIVKISDTTLGYAEPIYAEDICLTCHGKTLSPQVRLELGQRYPKDQATGFEFGEFRGIYWVEMPARAQTP